MNNLIIPPSPSWYLSSIIACNNNGVIAYGSRHEVVIIKPKNDYSPYNLEYSFIPLAHRERVNSLVFSPENASETFKNCLATASDDGSVRLWGMETLELKMANSGIKDQKVVAVDWSSSDPNVIISITDQAVIHCWDLASNRLRKLNLGSKITPLCLSICPHDKQLVAIGAKNGLLLIVSLKGEGNIKYRLRSHDSDVISLSWCPVAYNIFHQQKLPVTNGTKNDENEPTDVIKNEDERILPKAQTLKANDSKIEFLLASGSKDRSIYFWRAGTDGRYETVLNLPTQSFSSSYRAKMYEEKGGMNVSCTWGCLRWVDPFVLISGSQFGELLSWDLSLFTKSDQNKKSQIGKGIKLLHGKHSKGLFSMCCTSLSLKSEYGKKVVWTTALDRKLIACSLETGEILTELTTIGGIIYCMTVSPLDPNRIAVGVSDGKVLVWNMGCSDSLNIKVYWHKINSKVMALEWHPTEENWLAFATGEGRVGIIDTDSYKPIIFRQHHRRSVYRLLWAPHIIKEKDQTYSGKNAFALYSVGDGEILQQSVNCPMKEPVKLDDILSKADVSSGLEKSGRTEFVMNHDRSLIAVGNENGIIYILDGNTYEKQSTILAHKKLVQCINWHPPSVTSDPSGLSSYRNWIASASDGIKVANISTDGKSFEIIAEFSLHTEKIVDISWSPHLNGLLVSVSYDYTAQVWDAINQVPIANFSKHHHSVLCAVWSPLDPEYIITGSSDNTLRVWKVSEQPHVRPQEKKKNRITNLMKKFSNVREAIIDGGGDRSDMLQLEHSKTVAAAKTKKTNSGAEGHEVELDPVKEWEAGQTKRSKGKSLFPVTSAALSVSKHLEEYYQRWKANKNQNVTDGSADVIGDSASNAEADKKMLTGLTEFPYLDFFGNGEEMRKLMVVEETHLINENRMEQASQCVLWRGDISQLLRDALSKKQLNDWLMSLAPMASTRIWQQACVVYSEQLSNQGNYMKAACYLLAVHKVEEAVQLLMDHKLYREAVALAKCRLPNDDPVTHAAMRGFADNAISNGMLNLAAHCYLSIDDPLSASHALARCKDIKSLRLAALMANEANAIEIGDSLAKEAFCSSLMAGDFNSCSEIIMQHSNLEFLNIWMNTNKFLNANKRVEFGKSLSWLQGKPTDMDCVLDNVKKEAQQFDSCYDKLKSNVNCFIALDTEKQLWLYISSHLSLAGAALSRSVTLNHLVQALGGAYKFQIQNKREEILLHICTLLAPKGPLSENSIFRQTPESEEEKHLMSSIHSFLLAGIINWLNGHLEEIKDINIFGTESSELSKEDYKNFWLYSVIETCQNDLFDIRNVEYFKNERLIKNLELKIASSRCNITNDKGQQRVLLTAVRSKNKKIKARKQNSLDKKNADTVTNEINEVEKFTDTAEQCIKTEDDTSSVINKDVKVDVNRNLSESDSACINNDDTSVGSVKKEEILPSVEDKHVEIEEAVSKSSVIDVKVEKTDKIPSESDTLNGKDNITSEDTSNVCVKEVIDSKQVDAGDAGLIEGKNEISVIDVKDKKASEDTISVSSTVDNCNNTNLPSEEEITSNKEKDKEVAIILSSDQVGKMDTMKSTPTNYISIGDFQNNEDSKLLQKLNAAKQKFESERVSVPNPFYTYCEMQHVFSSLFKDGNPVLYESLNSKLLESLKTVEL